ncbi:DUF6241 domain-containing protein [Bacillus suaedaesalsae]|uniref:Uncharacterized protein n=1 Tax=Bacillus suaedaesalsae TaxID=2810349 RepID=A0ABS2DJV7_9BACI|nr:DUF6241 domain-containing protein [Bacillus suaedaesalsae]MBM6618749.1 hypothetical protein [Bacillus suaedaesalsae]
MKRVSIGVGAVMIVFIAGFTFWKTVFPNHAVTDITQETQEIGISTEEEHEEVEVTLPPEELTELESEWALDMGEIAMQNSIHAMSHQKVKAEDKWSHMPLTPERVNRLIEIVESSDYEFSKMYLEILYRWKEDDFTKAVEDHNLIWHLQKGSVGKAYALMTPKEEKEYIEQYYK